MKIKRMSEVMKNPDQFVFGKESSNSPFPQIKVSDFSARKWRAADFPGTWDAYRIIDAICELAALTNGWISIPRASGGPFAIKLQRLRSVLRAYNRPMFHSRFEGLISAELSQEKSKEIKELLYNMSSQSRVDDFYNVINNRADIFYIPLFRIIFKSYVILNKIANPYNGVLDPEHYLMFEMVKDMHERNIHLMRRLLVLLLGDDFDVPVTEVQLLEKYDYPTVTDEELQQIEIRWYADLAIQNSSDKTR